MNAPRIVVDSNVLISAALAMVNKKSDSPSAAIFSKIVGQDVIAVASPQMLYELAEKLSHPRFRFSPAFVLDFIDLLAQAVEMVPIRGLDMGCRDEADNMFIETAYNGRVDARHSRPRPLGCSDPLRSCEAPMPGSQRYGFFGTRTPNEDERGRRPATYAGL